MNILGASSVREVKSSQTRHRILEAAYTEIYHKGFQGMRLDDVLAATALTKGALYYHFPNKQSLGYSVIEEVIQPALERLWLQPLNEAGDPLSGLIGVIETMPDAGFTEEIIVYGCPLNNLAQEMSPLDEGFRQRLDTVFHVWHEVICTTLQRARKSGQISDDVDCDETATFILAAMEGCIGIAKNAQSIERLRRCTRGLVQYLLSLAN